MNIRTALRAPCHARTLVRSGIAAGLDEAALGRAQLASQGALALLCIVRIAFDVAAGRLTFESALALVILIAVAASLVIKAATSGRRHGGGGGPLLRVVARCEAGLSRARAGYRALGTARGGQWTASC